MKRNSIVLKLGSTIMVLFLVILLPLGFFIDRIFLEIYSAQVYDDVNELSENLSNTLNEIPNNNPEFYEYLSLIAGKKIVVFDSNGIVTSNSIFEYSKGNPVPNELVNIVKKGMHFERDYINPDTNEHFFFVGRPIANNGTFQGGILVFSSIDEIHNTMHNIRNWIIGSIVCAIILALGYSILVAKKLSRPLIKMEKATRDIAKGNLNTQVQVHTKDEVGSLAQAINDLSIELNNYRTNRSELLANISHELRTPISYLKGYAQLINNHQYENDEELESYAIIIEKESDRLTKLIEELFELSKMEEGKINLYMQSIDIEDVIESSAQKVKLKAVRRNLDLIVNIEEELPSIISDGAKIEQILLNLLENAINYSEEGKVIMNAKNKNNFIIISIKDTGIGIPKEDLPFIFDRFHRVEKSRSREMGGTGLGLAIVYELVKQLEGDIKVKSELGQGTEFILYFPIKSEENLL
ncbi:ATP-binding protein [Bacillus cereus]|uniref:ATP-binding protein n=1 Tax=Bacillus cereus TaxID=1396 RepID=UPI00380E672D